VTRIVVLASGAGTTFQALVDAFPPRGGTASSRDAAPSPASSGDAGASIVALVCNTPGALALERARCAGIPAVLIDHRSRSTEAFEADLTQAIESFSPDLICLAGFLRILTPAVIARFHGRLLNVHPALLPAFGGKGMYGERVHRAVLDAGVTVTGCTIHLVTEVPDGGPIVAQRSVPVLPGDTPERLAERVQAEERRLYPDVVRWWASGRLDTSDGGVRWRAAHA
jgi:phosphoribosylglycinamide formyltransferase-1